MTFILSGTERCDPQIAGGKAAALARVESWARVPSFVVLRPSSFAEDGVLRAEAAAQLDSALSPLGAGPYAVRSSAVGEDGATSAHAGQFLSILNVTRRELADAARRVWCSGRLGNVAAYRTLRGDQTSLVQVAVIVQQQLRPKVAGAAFTADPVRGDRNVITIAAVSGLADRLMAGEVDGDTYQLDRRGRVLLARLANSAAVLDEAWQRRVAELACRCEAAAGHPQDVEWALEGDELYLLQTRPITTLGVKPEVPTDDTLTIWDNSNIIESYPGVVSTLTFSFARHVYAHVYRHLLLILGVRARRVAAHRAVLDNLLGRIDGHVYYNLLNWYRTLALLPGFTFNRSAMEEMMGVANAIPPTLAAQLAPPAARGPRRILAAAEMLMVALRMLGESLRLPARVGVFNERLEAALQPPDPPLAQRPLTALAADYRALEGALIERWDAPLVNDLVCMIAFATSRQALKAWAGNAGLALHADTLVGQGDIVSAEPAQRIRRMGLLIAKRPDLIDCCDRGVLPPAGTIAELQIELEQYLQRFGDRCVEELKLESITLNEDPAPLLRAVAAAARATTCPQQPPRSVTQQTLATLLAGKPVRRFLAGRFLSWAKNRVRDRENLRLQRTRVFGRVRQLVREMGSQLARRAVLDNGADVFELTLEELLGAIEGGASSYDLRALIAARRAGASAASSVAPPERIEMSGAIVTALRDGRPPAAADAGDPLQRRGLGCAPGTVRGSARVVLDARSASLAPGEILVAQHTDPGWIALFTNAAAIVVERGSLLSHSAIVARELGIPCIVQLKGATRWLATGDLLEVNGVTGDVRRLTERVND
jgi:rifampicin phosphotransferase